MMLPFFLCVFVTLNCSRLQVTQASDNTSFLLSQEAEQDLINHLSGNVIEIPEFRQLEDLYNKELSNLENLSKNLQQNCRNISRFLNYGKPRPAFERAQMLETRKYSFPTAQSAGNVHPVVYYGPLKSFKTCPNLRIETGSVVFSIRDNVLNASTSSGGGVKITVKDQGNISYETIHLPDLVLIDLRLLSSIIPSFGVSAIGRPADFQLPLGGLFALLPRTILEQINETVFTISSASFRDVATTFSDFIESLGASFYLIFYVKGIVEN